MPVGGACHIGLTVVDTAPPGGTKTPHTGCRGAVRKDTKKLCPVLRGLRPSFCEVGEDVLLCGDFVSAKGDVRLRPGSAV